MTKIWMSMLMLTSAALLAGDLGCSTRGGAGPTVRASRPGQEAPPRRNPHRAAKVARLKHVSEGSASSPAELSPVAPRPDGSAHAYAGFSFEELRTGELGGRILHGSRPLFTTSDHDAYLAAFPETPSLLVGGGLNLGDIRRSPAERVRLLQERFELYPAEIPFVSIWYTQRSSDGSGDGDGLDIAVLRGKYDEDLLLVADMLKSFDRPVFVRIAPEFNTAWNGYHVQNFVSAYRHIVDLFRKRGVDNAITVWNFMPLNGSFPYLDWYPGDDVVDWWSLDVFDATFENQGVLDETTRFLAEAKKRGKPVVIAESAPATLDVGDPATWKRWFVPFFRLVNGQENIKAFLYSNVDFRKTTTIPDWRDVRLSGSAMVEKYAAELAKSRYVHRP